MTHRSSTLVMGLTALFMLGCKPDKSTDGSQAMSGFAEKMFDVRNKPLDMDEASKYFRGWKIAADVNFSLAKSYSQNLNQDTKISLARGTLVQSQISLNQRSQGTPLAVRFFPSAKVNRANVPELNVDRVEMKCPENRPKLTTDGIPSEIVNFFMGFLDQKIIPQGLRICEGISLEKAELSPLTAIFEQYRDVAADLSLSFQVRTESTKFLLPNNRIIQVSDNSVFLVNLKFVGALSQLKFQDFTIDFRNGLYVSQGIPIADITWARFVSHPRPTFLVKYTYGNNEYVAPFEWDDSAKVLGAVAGVDPSGLGLKAPNFAYAGKEELNKDSIRSQIHDQIAAIIPGALAAIRSVDRVIPGQSVMQLLGLR